MTKLRNKIVLVLLTLCLVVCAGVFAACGDDKTDNKPVTYTVTVKMDGEAVKGVTVTVKKGGVSYAPKTTDENGKVEFSLVKDSKYTVELDNLPENYEVPAGTSLSFPADRNLTVNIAEKFAYKVKLVQPNGDPFTLSDVTVGICIDGNCLTPVEVDANGLARIEAAKNDYHIKVFGLPANYAYECDADGYAMYQNEEGAYIDQGDENTYKSLSATKNEETVTIYPVNVLDLDTMTAMTEGEIAEYNDSYRTIVGYKAYKVQMQIASKQTAYYTFTAEYTGTYMLYAIGYNSSAGYKINPRFLLGDTVALGSGLFNQYGQAIEAVKGNQYYINVTALEEGLNCEFILTTPAASKIEVTGATTVKAEINKEGANAVIVLAPTAGAVYTLTVQGNGAISQADSVEEAENYVFEASNYTDNAATTDKFTEDQIGDRRYFAVSVNASEYPTTVDVVVTKTDLANTYNVIETEDTLATYARPAGNKELVPVPLKGEVELVKDDDGIYHYGAVDGPVVVVVLTEELDAERFGGGALAYIELYTNGMVNPYVVDVTSDEDRESLDKGNTYDDYREVLRGFKDYKYDKQNNPSVPNAADITVANYYTKYVNEDGAYPLTDELKGILQALTEEINYTNYMLLPDGDYENLWMFACYYYADYVEPDVIVGEYKFVTKVENDERISVGDQEAVDWDFDGNPTAYKDYTANTYKLVIERRHQFAIYELNADEEYEVYDIYKGTWSKSDDGIYTFTVRVMDWDEEWNVIYNNVDYSIAFNEATGAILLIAADGTEWEFTQKPSQADDIIVGEYEGDEYDLTVKGNGTFTFKDHMVGHAITGTWEKNEDGTYTFTENNMTWGLTVYDVEYDEYSGELLFYMQPEDPDEMVFDPTYVFAPAGEEEEDDGEPDFATLFSNEMSRADDTIAATKLGLYNDGTCILWQFNGRTYAYDKIATARWGANQAGTEVTITDITVMDDYEFTVTAVYNVDVEHMVGVITVTLTQGEGEDETSTPYTFYMPLQA